MDISCASRITKLQQLSDNCSGILSDFALINLKLIMDVIWIREYQKHVRWQEIIMDREKCITSNVRNQSNFFLPRVETMQRSQEIFLPFM